MPNMRWLFLFVLFSLAACSGKSLELKVPPANNDAPPEEGLSWASRAAIDAFFRGVVWKGDRSGFVAMFAQDGHLVYGTAAGWANIEARIPMQLDTRMRFASMTKPVTAVSAMILVEEGKLGLDDPVAQYVPAFSGLKLATSHSRNAEGSFDTKKPNNELLVRHLLMFSSGIGPGIESEPTELHEYWEANTIYTEDTRSLAERIDRMASLPLFEEPGTAWRYGWSADVLARVVEVAADQPYGDFVEERILQPLGMEATAYMQAGDSFEDVATVYTQDENGDLVMAKPRFDAYWTPGGSGLVSNAEDYMRFALMLWNGGEYQGVRILEPATIAEMRSLHMPEGVLSSIGMEGLGWGLGVAVAADSEASMVPDNNGDFWWSGFFGTTFFVSPATGLVGVLLSQNDPKTFDDDGEGGPIHLFIAQAIALAGAPERAEGD
ncbi:class A beta-lactamase-related serine hydrolase [Halioglobus maricola]|uniref:Class A beta-lactamase-related serine hydrolase n=1 Tax=Halioglobus maricola TaxID=2601894 RepID=A0A5P9NF64_9GAMM|nr:serine hydrolase domain-containing protein [Halioglobus maricola]QFU74402.1 class A beta-lactamase-related serine hydrolase [Halioglobus maricola]